MDYENNKHLHVGYYESGYDIEGIALKVSNKQSWDVFFNFKDYNLPIPSKFRKASESSFGTRIFSANNEIESQKRFSKWVAKELIQLLKKTNQR